MLLVIAIASTLVAIVMSVVAWRASCAERARSAARVETLARAIAGDGTSAFDLRLRPSEGPAFAIRPQPVLSAPQTGAVGSRLGLSLAAGAFVVTTAAAAAIVFSSESPTASANPSAQKPRAAEAVSAPIELVSLDHERDGDALIVRGVIRNPSGGVQMDGLAAVVSTVGLDGRARSNTRSAVDSPALIPGGQSTFSVTIPRAGDVARFRVGFRSGDLVVSHVDKRIGS
jgi:hypothetical protein